MNVTNATKGVDYEAHYCTRPAMKSPMLNTAMLCLSTCTTLHHDHANNTVITVNTANNPIMPEGLEKLLAELAPDAPPLLPVGPAAPLLDVPLGAAPSELGDCVPLASPEPAETRLQKTPFPSELVSTNSRNLPSAVSKAVLLPAWYGSLRAHA